jgi:hypothetical protein
MAAHILQVSFVKDPDQMIQIEGSTALNQRIKELQKSNLVTRIWVFTLTNEHRLIPTWNEIPCAPN